MATSKITNHVELSIKALPSQFRAKPAFAEFMESQIWPVQELEDLVWDMFTKRLLAGEGVQLDQAGKLVGEARDGKVDSDYLRYIQARIRTNRSNGTREDLLAIARLILSLDDAFLKIEPGYPAGLTMEVEDVVVSDALATDLIRFLQRAVADGVKVVAETWPLAADDMLVLPIFTSLSSGASAGSTALNVVATAGFPGTGSLCLDAGTADEEVVTYGGKTATDFTVVSACVNDHLTGCSVTLEDGGLGLGDSTDDEVGGGLASAKG